MYTAIKDAVLKVLETDDRTIETWGEVGLFINAAAMQDAKRAQKEQQKEPGQSSQPLSFLAIKTQPPSAPQEAPKPYTYSLKKHTAGSGPSCVTSQPAPSQSGNPTFRRA